MFKLDMTTVAEARLATIDPKVDFSLKQYVPCIGGEQEAKSWQRERERERERESGFLPALYSGQRGSPIDQCTSAGNCLIEGSVVQRHEVLAHALVFFRKQDNFPSA